jgi:MFS family permease
MTRTADADPEIGRRDLRLLIAARLLRAFAFGYSAVLIAVHLQSRGLSPVFIGLVLGLGLLTAALAGLGSAISSGRIGRRRTLTALGLLMSFSGIDLALAHESWLLVAAALTGMLGLAGTDTGPHLNVEQTVLAQAASGVRRNRAFGSYAFSGSIAGTTGALAATLGTTPARIQVFFGIYALLGLVTAILPAWLSSNVESDQRGPVFGNLRPLVSLFALLSLDALGGGVIVNSVSAYWLHVRFGASPSVLGPAFAGMSILIAVSQLMAGPLADRFGLIRTMVFAHFPSTLLLIAIPFMPSLAAAVGLMLLKSFLAAMDAPTRQAYLASIVTPQERNGALAVAGAIRGCAQALGPLITGAAIQAGLLALPFVFGGLTQAAGDLGVYVGFRTRLGDHETHLQR